MVLNVIGARLTHVGLLHVMNPAKRSRAIETSSSSVYPLVWKTFTCRWFLKMAFVEGIVALGQRICPRQPRNPLLGTFKRDVESAGCGLNLVQLSGALRP